MGAAGHDALHIVPHLFDVEGAWQSPPQSIFPAPQVHTLFSQNSVPMHGLPQPLQFLPSLVVLTQVVPQSVGVAEPQASAHVVPLHVATPVPAVGPGQAGLQRPPAPHPLVGPIAWQVPLQSTVPAGHAHRPVWQVLPPAQAKMLPQPPQLLLSVCSLTHPPAHGV
jgi:hypothetical protein